MARRNVERLLGLAGGGARLGLERFRTALAALGDPQRGLACVHVAGTNGKGSVCAMVEAIARAAGLRTGLYTSPHLQRLNERIRIDGRPIEDDALEAALELALDPRFELTFFEAITAAAFVAMRSSDVEVAILEVGLGGRLDATNVIDAPVTTAITSIGLDHQRYLGETLGEIAGEKAGIVKRGAPLVLGAMPADAEEAILTAAERVESGPVWRVDRELRLEADEDLIISAPDGRTVRARPALVGAHQASNAAVAAGIAWQLDERFGPSGAIARGLAETHWPGRLERLQHPSGVPVLLDCAHNPDGARALAAALPTGTPITLLFGAMDDKAWPAMLDTLAPLTRARVYCAPDLDPAAGRWAVDPHELAARLPGDVASSPEEALTRATAGAQSGGLVVVTGSIYLVGAIRALVTGEPRDRSVPL